jgi:multidrug resistance efflux pump
MVTSTRFFTFFFLSLSLLVVISCLQVVPVSRQPMTSSLHETGQIHCCYGREVQVRIRTSGRVVAAFIQPGVEVKTGQPLFRMDSGELADLEAEVIETEARLKVAVNRENSEKEIQGLRSETGHSRKDCRQLCRDHLRSFRRRKCCERRQSALEKGPDCRRLKLNWRPAANLLVAVPLVSRAGSFWTGLFQLPFLESV